MPKKTMLQTRNRLRRPSRQRRSLATLIGLGVAGMVLPLANCSTSNGRAGVPEVHSDAGSSPAAAMHQVVATAPDEDASSVESSSGSSPSEPETPAPTCTPFVQEPDAGSPMPNCSPGGDGLTNCGAAGESCCTSLPVTGGTFDWTYWYSDIIDGGYTRDPITGELGPNVVLIPTDAGRGDPATVSNFRLDKYEVTVEGSDSS